MLKFRALPGFWVRVTGRGLEFDSHYSNIR